MNDKMQAIARENSEQKVQIQLLMNEIQKLKQDNQALRQQSLPNDMSVQEKRHFKILEEEKKKLQSDYDKLWEMLRQKEEDYQKQNLEIERSKELKRDIDKYKSDKQQVNERLKKMREDFDEQLKKLHQDKLDKENQIIELEVKIKQMHLQGMGESKVLDQFTSQNQIKELAQLVEDLKNNFATARSQIEQIDGLQKQNQELQSQLMKLQLEKQNIA